MKKLILAIIMASLTIPGLTQKTDDLFGRLTDKYQDYDGFSASQLTSDMFDLYLKKREVEELSPVYEALKSLDRILVVSQSNLNAEWVAAGKEKEAGSESDLHEFVLDYYSKSNFTLFKTEKQLGEDVKVYLKKSGEKIQSLALVTNSSASTNLVELQGDIDLKTVSELNKALNIRGLENLYKIENSSSGFWRSTGLGSLYSREKLEEMMEQKRHQMELQKDISVEKSRQMEEQARLQMELQSKISEEQRKKFEEQAFMQSERGKEIAERYRELAEKYRRQPIFLNYPGDTNTVYYLDGKIVDVDKIKEIDKEKIESIEVQKPDKGEVKTTIKIKTK